MGKTNFAILGLGFAACVLLSLMMQHALEATKEGLRPKVIRELEQNYSFERSPVLSITTVANGGRVAELEIAPQLSSSARRLVRAAGEFVWRNGQGDDDERFDLLVVVVDVGDGRRTRYEVPSPTRMGASIRVLSEGEHPQFPTGWQPGDQKVGGKPAAGGSDSVEPAVRATESQPMDQGSSTSRPSSRPTAANGHALPTSRPADARPPPK